MRKTGRPRRPLESYPECLAEGCKRKTKGGSKGFCQSHYVSFRRGYLTQEGVWTRGEQESRGRLAEHKYEGVPCKGPRCSAQAQVKGFCKRHYQQLRQGILDDSGKQIRVLKKWQRPRSRKRWHDPAGYVLVYAPEGSVAYPGARLDGTILEHRLVMSTLLGRPLEDWEIVHHKNGDRADNRPENLELMDGRARRGQGHPPGSGVTAEYLEEVLQHLKHNDPAAFTALLERLQDERSHRPHQEGSGS